MTNWREGTIFQPEDRVVIHASPTVDMTGIVTFWGTQKQGENGAESVEIQLFREFDKNEWWETSDVDLISRRQARNSSDVE